MKVSGETLQTLAAFTQINGNLLIREGNIQGSVSNGKNIFCRARLEDSFPKEFGIYNVKEFLDTLTFDINPELEFQEECVKVSYSDLELYHYYTHPDVIRQAPDKDIELGDVFYSFDFTRTLQQKLKKFTKNFRDSISCLALEAKGGSVKLNAMKEKKIPKKHGLFDYEYQPIFSADIGKSNHEFSIRFCPKNLSVPLELEYEARLDDRKFLHLKAKDRELQYWLAIEPNSSLPKC